MQQGFPPANITPEYLQLLGMTRERVKQKIHPGFNTVGIE